MAGGKFQLGTVFFRPNSGQHAQIPEGLTARRAAWAAGSVGGASWGARGRCDRGCSRGGAVGRRGCSRGRRSRGSWGVVGATRAAGRGCSRGGAGLLARWGWRRGTGLLAWRLAAGAVAREEEGGERREKLGKEKKKKVGPRDIGASFETFYCLPETDYPVPTFSISARDALSILAGAK